MYTFPFWIWAAGTVGKSFIYAWLFNSSGRSLTVVILFHIAINTFGSYFGIRSFITESAIDLATASLLLLIAGPTLGYNADTF
jgi:membrane protease YdiL (CAAX protease family)